METNTSVQIVNPNDYGIEESKSSSIEKSFIPKQVEFNAFLQQYESVIKKELNNKTFKEARELRLKLVKVRTGIADIHKSEKAFFLASGKYVDALKNKLTLPIEQMESKLNEIEKYEERIEKERKEKLTSERLLQLEPYGFDTSFLPLGDMSQEQFDEQLYIAKNAYENKIKAEKEAEELRIVEQQKREEEYRQLEIKREEEIKIQKLENERLRKEAEQREAELKKANQERENKRLKLSDKAKKELIKIGFSDTDGGVSHSLIKHFIGKQHYSQFDTDTDLLNWIESIKISIERGIAAKQAEEEKIKALAELKQKNDAERAKKEHEEKRLKDIANAGDKAILKEFFENFKKVELKGLTSIDGIEIQNYIHLEFNKIRKEIIERAKKLN